jgi:hypothetical protein
VNAGAHAKFAATSQAEARKKLASRCGRFYGGRLPLSLVDLLMIVPRGNFRKRILP